MPLLTARLISQSQSDVTWAIAWVPHSIPASLLVCPGLHCTTHVAVQTHTVSGSCAMPEESPKKTPKRKTPWISQVPAPESLVKHTGKMMHHWAAGEKNALQTHGLGTSSLHLTRREKSCCFSWFCCHNKLEEYFSYLPWPIFWPKLTLQLKWYNLILIYTSWEHSKS